MSVIIETERLILRTWRPSDVAPFYTMNQDPDVIRYLKGSLSIEQASSFYERMKKQYQERGYTLYAVAEKNGAAFIGFVGLNYTDFLTHLLPSVEIGWRLAFPFWGKGYATEAAQSVLRYAFENLRLPEVISFTTIQNKASVRVMEKIGLKRNPADDFLHPKLEDSNPLRPHVLYRLTLSEWQLQQTQLASDVEQ